MFLTANVTLLSLAVSRSLVGPYVSSTDSRIRRSLAVRDCAMSRFASSFLLGYGDLGLDFRSSRFEMFQDSAIKVRSGECDEFASKSVISGCVFVRCVAENGAAIYRAASTNCTIEKCNFLTCTASVQGGAIYCVGTKDCSESWVNDQFTKVLCEGVISIEASCFVNCISETETVVDTAYCAYSSNMEKMNIEGVTCSDCDRVCLLKGMYCFVGGYGDIGTNVCNFTSPNKLGHVGFICGTDLNRLADDDVRYTSCENVRFRYCHYLEKPIDTYGFNPKYCQYFNMTFTSDLLDENPACFMIWAAWDDQLGIFEGMLGFGVIFDVDAEQWKNGPESRCHLTRYVGGNGWLRWTKSYTDFDQWQGDIVLTGKETRYTINPGGEAFCDLLPTNAFTASSTFTPSNLFTPSPLFR